MLAIEPLAIAIMNNQHIIGIEINEIDNKIALFVDILILFHPI